MYDHGRLPTLTDAYRRLPTLIPSAGLLLLPRVTVAIHTQCDWAFRVFPCQYMQYGVTIGSFSSPGVTQQYVFKPNASQREIVYRDS